MKKLSSMFRILCPLLTAASCANNGQPPSGGDGQDGDFEGIEEATQGLTDLSGQCSFVSGTGVATFAMVGDEVALINKLSSGALGINGFPCSTATVTALKKLVITGDAGAQTVILDYLGGVFAPGTATGVGVDVDLGGGSSDALKFRGTKLADAFVFGASGITINADLIKDVTYANVETFVVTMSDGNDTFSGAGSATTGAAFATAVTVYGGAGDDVIRGGNGNDTLNGGDGNDTFTTGAAATDGNDTLVGGAGTDTADYSLRTLAVNLSLDGTANDGDIATTELDNIGTDIEVLKGGLGNDILSGGAVTGPLTISGGPGNDTISGGAGNDILNGDDGNDVFNEGSASNGGDTFNGGAGIDRVSYASRTNSVTIKLDGTATSGETNEKDKIMADVENATGGGGDDTITGSALDNVLDGGAGIDTISGGAGNDTLIGGAGNDILHGDAGDDVFDEGSAASGDDTIVGGAGTDTVDYSARTNDLTVVMDGLTSSGEGTEADKIATDVENLKGGAGDDHLTGNVLDNVIEGGAGDDTIVGLEGDDTIDGAAGDDTIDCGVGDADLLLDAVGTNVVSNCEL